MHESTGGEQPKEKNKKILRMSFIFSTFAAETNNYSHKIKMKKYLFILLASSFLYACGDKPRVVVGENQVVFSVYDTIVGEQHCFYAQIVRPDTCVREYLTDAQVVEHIQRKRNGYIYYYPSYGKHKALFERIIRLVETYAQSSDTIFTLLEGDFGHLAIEAIPYGSDERYLGDVYHFHRISSLRFLTQRHSLPSNGHYIIFGDVAYNHPRIKELEGSRIALDSLEKLKTNRAFEQIIYRGQEATTATFMQLNKQQLDNILVSTHGEYMYAKDDSREYNLIFAGGDGVPVSKIAGMDLSGISTIVVTACQSGKNWQAFKKAGANTIISHIWDTNDKAAELFIETYYSEWLSGKTPREAYDAARQKIRKDLEEPIYWAGFIMLD